MVCYVTRSHCSGSAQNVKIYLWSSGRCILFSLYCKFLVNVHTSQLSQKHVNLKLLHGPNHLYRPTTSIYVAKSLVVIQERTLNCLTSLLQLITQILIYHYSLLLTTCRYSKIVICLGIFLLIFLMQVNLLTIICSRCRYTPLTIVQEAKYAKQMKRHV